MEAERAPGTPPVAALLRERAERSRREAALLAGRIERASLARLGVALLVMIAAAGAFGEPRHRAAFVLALVLATAGFVALVVRSRRLTAQRNAALGRATVSEQGAFRAERLWARIDPQPWSWPRDEGERQRVDLDVAGPESLVQLLPSISAAVGAARMREWLTAIAEEETIRARQASVRELVHMVELREAFELAARRLHLPEARVAAFVEWGRASHPSAPTSRRARARDAVRAADDGARMADAYAGLIGLVCDATFESPLLRQLQEKLGGESATRADAALRQIRRVAAWAEVRASPMMHAVLQLLVAWDYQVVRAVERWRTSFGPSLGTWFDALAEIECLAALAGLAYANPAWTFAELAPERPTRLRARGLGHPLLPDSSRVLNDVEVGPPGTVLLISGSNMSGKSTLLRAIGLNALLARVGGPVCADAMWCAPLRLQTSLRVQDSLAEGISYFMAEALRLRDIVYTAEGSAEAGTPPVLYLVDEILRGTNSEERAVASRFIVARLLKTPAIGVITTHDLGVFDVPEIAERARHAHFAEQFIGEGAERRLTFDYRLRAGPTTSSNALQLLSLIGLRHAPLSRARRGADNMGMAAASESTRWTAERVRALPNDGNRYEVIDGELFVTPAPTWDHQAAVFALAVRLHDYLRASGAGSVMIAPADVEFDNERMVEPDVFVVPLVDGRRPRDWKDVRRLLLAVEILSPSSARADRQVKRRLYQRERVPEYWVVDIDARLVERWRPDDARPELLDQRLDWQPDPARAPAVIDLARYFADVVGE